MTLLNAYLSGMSVKLIRYAQTPEGLMAILSVNGQYVTRHWNASKTRTAERLLAALKQGNVEFLLTEDDLYKHFERAGEFVLKEGKAYYKDEPVHPVLARRIVHFIREGKSLEPFALFVERLRSNPSGEAIETFYEVLDRYQFPILPDGRFLGYKAVKKDYYDIHTGKTFRYLVGTTHKESRSVVNPDRAVGCGRGIHVGTFAYASSFGGHEARFMGVACCPSDVVVVPSDCSWQKIRLSKVEVVKEFETREELWDALVSEHGEQFVGESGASLLIQKPVTFDGTDSDADSDGETLEDEILGDYNGEDDECECDSKCDDSECECECEYPWDYDGSEPEKDLSRSCPLCENGRDGQCG